MSETGRKLAVGLLSVVALLALGLALNALFAARAGPGAFRSQQAASEAATPTPGEIDITPTDTPVPQPSPSHGTAETLWVGTPTPSLPGLDGTPTVIPAFTPPTPLPEWTPIVLPSLEAPLAGEGTGLVHVDVTSIRVTQIITIPLPCAIKFAPDGHRFACDLQWTGQLWLGSLEQGAERQVAEGFPIRWTPDGQDLLLATRWPQVRKFNLHLLENPGQGAQRLLVEGMDDDRIDYVPGTREVAFIKDGELHLLSLETGIERVFSRGMFSDLEYFAQSIFRVSPDGSRVAIADLLPQGNSLSILNLESGEEVHIAGGGKLDTVSEWYPMAWSSDGRYLAYGISPWLKETGAERPELWIVDADGTNPRKLHVESTGFEESGVYPRGHYEFLQWLPGGDAIFFIYVPRGTNPYRQATYQVISAADGTRQVLFSGGGYLELVKGGRFLTFYSAEDDFSSLTRLVILAYGPEEAQP